MNSHYTVLYIPKQNKSITTDLLYGASLIWTALYSSFQKYIQISEFVLISETLHKYIVLL